MQILWFAIDENDRECLLRLVSDNQEESAYLFEIGKRLKAPIKTEGRIDRDKTSLWLELPMKRATLHTRRFDNGVK
jgi:hypothetical protein